MIDLVKIPTFTVDEIEKILGDPHSEYNQNPSVRVMLSQRMDELKGGSSATPTAKAPKQAKAKTPTVAPSNASYDQTINDIIAEYNFDDSKAQQLKNIFYTYSKNVDRHYQLYLLGLNANDIQRLTQAPIPSIKRDIWKKNKDNA